MKNSLPDTQGSFPPQISPISIPSTLDRKGQPEKSRITVRQSVGMIWATAEYSRFPLKRVRRANWSIAGPSWVNIENSAKYNRKNEM